jgi:hypothetical protein
MHIVLIFLLSILFLITEIDYNLNTFPNKITNGWPNLIHETCPLFVLIDTGANGSIIVNF